MPEVWGTALCFRPRGVLKGTVFSHTDQSSPVINLFFLGGGGVTSFESGKRDSNKRHDAYKAAKTKKSNARMIFSNWLLL